MQEKSYVSRAFWIIIIGGMVTGMGNGSVFGAAMMCFLGRGDFANWGGWWPLSYEPQTFDGFINWCMIVFGVAYSLMLWIALRRHDVAESQPAERAAERAR